MKLSESQFVWPSIWVCSLCSPCLFVLDDLNETFWILIHLTKYLSLFTLFTLFTCSQGFEWSSMNLNSFDQVFEFAHFVHLFSRIWMKLYESQIICQNIWVCSLCSLVHLFSRIWMKLCESQFIWLTTWVCLLCSHCSLVHKDFNEAFWISIHLTKYLSLFTLFTCS